MPLRRASRRCRPGDAPAGSAAVLAAGPHLANEVQRHGLQDVAPRRDLLHVGQQVRQRALLRVVVQHEEGVASRRQVALALQELLHRLRRLGQHVLSIGQSVDCVDSQHRVAPHEAVAVLQVGHDRRDERFDDLRLLDAAQEAQRDAADVFVRVLQVVAQVLADEDHLRQDAPVGPRLLDDLHVQQKQLLHRVVLRRQHVAHDGDEDLRQQLAVQQLADHVLHRRSLGRRVAAFEGLLDLIGARGAVAGNQQAAAALHQRRHGADRPPPRRAARPRSRPGRGERMENDVAVESRRSQRAPGSSSVARHRQPRPAHTQGAAWRAAYAQKAPDGVPLGLRVPALAAMSAATGPAPQRGVRPRQQPHRSSAWPARESAR